MKKQLLTSLAIALVAVTSWAQTLNIGGHRAPLDTINNMWLCSVPQALFGSNYDATVSFGDEMSELLIEDVAIANGEIFTFQDIEGGKFYTVSVMTVRHRRGGRLLLPGRLRPAL